jgi:hypothetical protein
VVLVIFDSLFVAVLGLLAAVASIWISGLIAVTLVIAVLSILERHATRKPRKRERPRWTPRR